MQLSAKIVHKFVKKNKAGDLSRTFAPLKLLSGAIFGTKKRPNPFFFFFFLENASFQDKKTLLIRRRPFFFFFFEERFFSGQKTL